MLWERKQPTLQTMRHFLLFRGTSCRSNMLALAVGPGNDASAPCMPSAVETQERAPLCVVDLNSAKPPGITQPAARMKQTALKSKCAEGWALPRSAVAKALEPSKAPRTWAAVFSAEVHPDSKLCSSSATHLLHSPWSTGTLQEPAVLKIIAGYNHVPDGAKLYAVNLAKWTSRQSIANRASLPCIAQRSNGKSRNWAAMSVKP
mmetsp:Transcript_32843/g.83385  ORF Transcript_32843/g.83385 Transcript_32843/m.83385 type:complete len:204 (+) Transcript_32843:194-805(+)